MPTMHPDTRLDRMLRRKVSEYASRGDSDSEFLAKAADLMQLRKDRLKIPDRSIVIISYLATHNTAVIVPDANVTQAFNDAKRAFAG